ncbi:translocation/assembly module TamB domain-containing protein [Thermus sp. LT1-2-5]|uniref:translocation/assembly module TamB domain-containing protein n=1 Tax=Thermus sp. LT1-2-5 TaxID=3026935 RepID=UPI0033658EF2
MRRGLFLLLLVLLLGLLAWPPLLKRAVLRGLALGGFSGQVEEVRGHLLLGLTLRGVRLQGEGLFLEAEEVGLRYDLLGLLRRELPLSLTLRGARLKPTWEALFPEKPGPPPALKVVFRSLVLEDAEVELPQGKRLFLPPLRLTLVGENPYRFLARLPGGSFRGEARALAQDLSAWEVRYRGEVSGLSFFYQGLKGGRLFGVLRLGPQGPEGEAQVEGGLVELVGFSLAQVEGPIRLQGDRVTARLRGRGLEGPLWAAAEVDLKGERYRFRLEGRPKLPALARHFGLSLPVEGEGALVLEGEGWAELRLKGEFQGEGRFLGEPFRHRGQLGFDRVFSLAAEAEGRLFDRTYRLDFALEGRGYRVAFRDSLASRLAFRGEGSRLVGGGVLAWPRPLEGKAEVALALEEGRYRAQVRSPGVRLPLFAPLDLSGEVQGEGGRVYGRLGPLALSGPWSDLALSLSPTPLAVGSLEGEGRLREGRLSALLRYASPYAAFPVAVAQEASGFRFQSPYGEGTYRRGVLALRLLGLPVRALDEVRLYGEAFYREGALGGRLRAEGRYLEAEASLRRLGAELSGRLKTPLGALPFRGAYDPGPGLWLRAGGLLLAYREALSLKGEAALGPLALRADLAYDGSFSGFAQVKTPYGIEGWFLGAGRRLFLRLGGYVEGEGEVYPELRLKGHLTPPLPEGLRLPPLAFALDREALRVAGVGEVGLRGRYPFRLDLPFRYRGVEGRLWAEGDLEGGAVRLATPYGTLEGKGPWRAVRLWGRGAAPLLGEGRLAGAVDLLALAYRGEAFFPKGGLALAFSGRGAGFRLEGRAPGLRLLGGYEGGLRLLLQAEGLDLSPWGLPLRATGTWGTQGGRLRLESPYGEALLQGEGLLRARVRLLGPYGEGEGEVSPSGYRLALKAHYRQGGVEVRGEASGEGSWEALALEVQGEARLPYLDPLPFRGRVWREGGVRYALEGPVRLAGEGLAYQGSLALPFRALGREGEVRGVFQGEGLRLRLEGEGRFAGVPFAWEGRYGEGLALALRYPGGEVALEKGRVRLALEEVAPWAEAFGLALTGRVEGEVGLDGRGRAEARLAYGKEPLALAYQDGELSLWLPKRGVGLAWEAGVGALRGLGALVGGGRLDREGVEAAFRYRGLDLSLQGPLSALRVRGLYREEALGETGLEATLDLFGLKGEGRVRHASSYAEGELALSWEGTRYWGEGSLRSLRYLVQEGPLRLSGEGGRVEVRWQAPLALGVAYGEGLSLFARGRGEVAGFLLEADLGYGKEGYVGWLRASRKGLTLLAQGEGPLRFRLQGEGLPGRLAAEGEVSGLALSGAARYALEVGKAHLAAAARLGGTLLAPRLAGEGVLAGEGAGLPFRFAQEGFSLGGLALSAEASGLRLRLAGERLSLEADLDLTPFGLPARLVAEGEGPWQGPLAFRLLRPEGEVAGRAWLSPLRAEFQGEAYGEAFRGSYGAEGLALSFLGPRVLGEVRYQEALSGRLQVAYPLPEGGVRGEVDLGSGRFALRGEGALWGGGEGRFCLPRPLGACAGLEGEVALGLGYREVSFRGAYRYRAEAGYLGAWWGEGAVESPYGGVRLVGRGEGLDLVGEGLPLTGRLELAPFRLAYRYQGPLPRGLGELWAEGTYPGPWLSGRYAYGGVALALEGLPGFRVALQGEGVKGEVGPEGLELALSGFAYGPLRLWGEVGGSWREVGLNLRLAALGREAQVAGVYGKEGLRLGLRGDLEGEVAWDGAWRGEVAFREGRVALEGEGLPRLRGTVLGEEVALAWPRLTLGGLGLDLVAREAQGEATLLRGLLPGGVAARGAGKRLFLAYRVPGVGLPLEGELDLESLALTLSSPEGTGALRYAQGQVSGGLALEVGGVALRLQGEGAKVGIEGEHPAFPWWAAGAGRLGGEVGLDGAYRLDYRAGEQEVRLEGRLLSAELTATGPYLEGRLAYPPGGELRVDLPLPPLESRFQGRILGEGLRVEGVLAGGVGRVEAQGTLLPLALDLTLQEAALEDFLGRYTPYLKGRVSGSLALKGGGAEGAVSGAVEVAGTRLSLSFKGRLGPGGLSGEGRLGETPFRVALEGERLDLTASPRGFPLHLLLAAVAGPLEGEAYWTGAVRLRVPLADPWRGEGVLVGESLVFRGGEDELRGRAAFRLEGGKVWVEALRLAGRGVWEGGGYWSPQGSDLYLNLKDTVFTPVLQVVPALKPYRPEGSGSLSLRLKGESFQVGFKDFRFRLGPVAGYVPEGLLSLDGGAKAEGELTLTAPFPGQARLGLEGRLEDFRVSAKGEVSLPGLKEATPAEVVFRYPTGLLEVRLGGLEAQGTLFPLRLAGYGRLTLTYPSLYLQEGLLDVKGFFLYQEGGNYHLTANAEVLRARLVFSSARENEARGPKEAGPSQPLPLVFENVRLYAERGVLVQESLVQGEVGGEVYLGGPYQDPYLSGEARPLRGTFRLWDVLFNVVPEGSAIRFSPSLGILPEFTLRATGQARGYVLHLQAEGGFFRENGRVKLRLDPKLTTEPELSELEAYSLLILGTPDLNQVLDALPQTVLSAALESLLVGQLEQELGRVLGLDQFQIRAPLFQGGQLEDTRFSVGKYVTPNLFLGYEVDLRGAQSVFAQYRQDRLTLSLSSRFPVGEGAYQTVAFQLGYELTPTLGLSIGVESGESVRFSVGALYRW